MRVYIGVLYKNTAENVLIGINSCFISSSLNWSGELGIDAVETQGSNEVIVFYPLAATFLAFSFFFECNLFLASFHGLACNPRD